MSYWWISFCDHGRMKGNKFLGALVIKADSHWSMLRRSWMLELNPGGEAQFYEIPKEYHERIPQDWIETRLLTRDECEEFEKKWMD